MSAILPHTLGRWMPCGEGTLLYPGTLQPVLTRVVEAEGFGRIFEIFDYSNESEGNFAHILRSVALRYQVREVWVGPCWSAESRAGQVTAAFVQPYLACEFAKHEAKRNAPHRRYEVYDTADGKCYQWNGNPEGAPNLKS